MYKRIRDLREDRDLTQKNMGEILNCANAFIVITSVAMLIFPLRF